MSTIQDVIDLSRLPAPAIIQVVDNEALIAQFHAAFALEWAQARLIDPSLPTYDVEQIRGDPIQIAHRAVAYLRLLDRQAVNDGFKATVPAFSFGADLDHVVSRAGIARLVLVPANAETGTPAVMESDAALLRRYLLGYRRPAAGSTQRYLYEAWTAWPQMGDCRVNGRRTHGRRGDMDIVITGPGGRLPTSEERDLVRDAVLRDEVTPEGLDAIVLLARRQEYQVEQVIEVPRGPDPALLETDAEARIRAVADLRTSIGGEVPAELLAGAAYGPNIIRVRDLAPVELAPDPYAVPVCTGITVTAQVRS
ncbi:MAG: baseplate assembly protein [Methylobacterium sp.]|nr:baseplate assembly protein [Methylobacterium sp.]